MRMIYIFGPKVKHYEDDMYIWTKVIMDVVGFVSMNIFKITIFYTFFLINN